MHFHGQRRANNGADKLTDSDLLINFSVLASLTEDSFVCLHTYYNYPERKLHLGGTIFW